MPKTRQSSPCPACGSHEWCELPNPVEGRSVTTDGRLLTESLDKRHCGRCALVERAAMHRFDEETSFYSDVYDFYDRPAMREFERARYRAYAEWLLSRFPGTTPRRILEIGCGQGWLLEALAENLPDSELIGIEPSRKAVKQARLAGLDVVEGFAGSAPGAAQRDFDFVFSVNVIEHTGDPVGFLKNARLSLCPNGILAVVCPNGQMPHTELLFADHLHSMTRRHLEAFCTFAGLVPLELHADHPSLPQFQVLYARRGDSFEHEGNVSGSRRALSDEGEAAQLWKRRRDYLEGWVTLDDRLLEKCGAAFRLICFGTGETSDLLRAYAPKTWQRVAGYLLDDTESLKGSLPVVVNELPVSSVSEFSTSGIDAILLGTKPKYHPHLLPRLKRLGLPVIGWDDHFAILE